MPGRIDFERLRRRAGNLTGAELVRLARELGWRELPARRGKGSHHALRMAGVRRTLIIPAHLRRRVALNVLRDLEASQQPR